MIEHLKSYTNNRVTLLKIEVIEAVAKGFSKTISILLLSLFFFFTYFFLMFGLAWFIGERYFDNSVAMGFFVISGFHFLLFTVVLILKGNVIHGLVLNSFITAAFNPKTPNDETT